jgi:hypothetical protein
VIIEHQQALHCPAPLVLRDSIIQDQTTTTTAADFWCVTSCIAARRAVLVELHTPQISPDKNMNYRNTTAGFTVQRGHTTIAVLCLLDPAAQPCIRFLFIGSLLCT